MNKILIVHPDLARLGGVEAYFDKLFPYLTIPYISFPIARRRYETSLTNRVRRILGDYHRFWTCLANPDVTVVHLNPSLEFKSFYRESLFLFLAKLRRKKVVVFFRGWNLDFARRLDRHGGYVFRLFYGRADAYIVLAQSFGQALKRWGVKRPIHYEVTIIDDSTIDNFDLQTTLNRRLVEARQAVLFIARLTAEKGVLETIEAFQLVRRDCLDATLVIAGDGELSGPARARVALLGLRDVEFTGEVNGAAKDALFRAAYVLCFPTAHGEGLPNTVVEAMAYGLPVVTCAVGGLADFFNNHEHGFLAPSREPEKIAQLVTKLLRDTEAYKRISRANYDYACMNFRASLAARRLEHVYTAVITASRA